MKKTFLGIPAVLGVKERLSAVAKKADLPGKLGKISDSAARATSMGPDEDPNLGWAPGVPEPEDPLRWGDSFPTGAAKTLKNTQMRRNIRHAATTIRNKRDLRVSEMPDWEELREAASQIKHWTMSNLPDLLVELEKNVTARGGTVHWARDSAEANQIVGDLIAAKGVDEVVKIKSMATQEIGLNQYLSKRGIKAWETDLAEMIVQLSEDMPSHIVVPGIHRNRAEIRAIFADRMGDAPQGLSENPRELAMAARAHLRKKFLSAKVAVSGSNMVIADTGTVSIVESEGNGRMCLTLPQTLISVVGIEKVLPTFQDVEVFMQLLPRSATGERMNPYTSFWTGVTPGDGPQEFHLVLIDNGRTKALADEIGRQALHCIRCGACMNVCPVYEHVGGHAYNSVYPGPIGAILTPQLLHAVDHHDPAASLPFASSLCGACYEACPVKIDIPTALVHLRARYVEANRGGLPNGWDIGMKAASVAMRSGKRMDVAGRVAKVGRIVAGPKRRIKSLPYPGSLWTGAHDIPAPPSETFRQWWDSRPQCGQCPQAPTQTPPKEDISAEQNDKQKEDPK